MFYTKYRPQKFEQLFGLEPIARALTSQLEKDQVGHAYLFHGPRGTGKTTVARILAKEVGCRGLDLIEIDAASNRGIDDIRNLREKIGLAPTEGPYKVYVVDECFRYEDLITLADGSKLPIGKIVEDGLHVNVLSYNEQTNTIEPKPVVRRMRKRPELPVVRITFDNNRALACTINHKFYTPNGQIRAGELEVGQFVNANYERITQHQLAVIAGAALGDGHIALTGSQMRARLSITQGVEQKEYLDCKMQLLGNLVETLPAYQHSPRSFSKKGTYRLATVSCPQLAELRRELYDRHGHKRISRAFLDRLTSLGLALWYLDDGSLVTRANYYTRKDGTIANYPNTRSTLSVYGFSVGEAHLMMQWLQEKWVIEGGIAATAKGPVIWLTLGGTKRLHEIIASYVPPSMAYKLLPAYRGKFCLPTDDGTLGGLAVSVVKRVERIAPPKFVYNIEVADNHNYFARDILVANCHMLTKEAFNALLKTLEEPPAHAILILCTTEPHKVPETIRSRCQKFEFKRASTGDIVRKLKFIVEGEGVEVTDEDLELIAKNAEGGFRDAETMLEQVIVGGLPVAEVVGLAAGESVGEFVELLLNKQVPEAIQFINRTYENGSNLDNFGKTVLEYLRGLLLIKNGVGEKLLEAPEENYKRMKEQAERLSVQNLDFMITEFTQVGFQLQNLVIPQLPFELAITRIAEKVEVGDWRLEIGDGEETKNSHKISPEDKNESKEQKPVSGIVSKWDTVLQKVRSYNHSLEALLKSARPLKMEGESLILEVFYKFHKERLEETKNKNILEKVLNEVTGLPVKVRCILGKKGNKLQDVVDDFDAVEKKAVEVFNGEL